MFKKSQYLKKSAAHRQLTKLANAAQVIRVNRRLAKKAGAGMGDVVASAHSKPAAAGPQKPAPAYTPLAGRHPRRPAMPVVPKAYSDKRINLRIPHTNPYPWSYGENNWSSYNRFNGAIPFILPNAMDVTFADRSFNEHNPYKGVKLRDGIYAMSVPFLTGNTGSDTKSFMDWLNIPGVNHSFNVVLLTPEQHAALKPEEQKLYREFPTNDGKFYGRTLSASMHDPESPLPIESQEQDFALAMLLANHSGPISNFKTERFNDLPSGGYVNNIAYLPTTHERYENGEWVTDDDPITRGLHSHNIGVAMHRKLKGKSNYTITDSNCHSATVEGALTAAGLHPLVLGTGGLRGSQGVTGGTGHTVWCTPFYAYTATPEDIVGYKGEARRDVQKGWERKKYDAERAQRRPAVRKVLNDPNRPGSR